MDVTPLIRPAILLLAAAAALAAPLLNIPLDRSAGAALWAASLLLFGMPHGAYDAAVVLHQAKRAGAKSAIRTAALYTLATAASIAALIAAPAITVVAFLALSAHHFGVSDCVWTRGRPARTPRDHLLGLSHGVAVLTVPFIAAPAAAWAPFEAIATACGGTLDINDQLTRAAAAASWLAAATIIAFEAIRDRAQARAREQLAVIGAAAALGLTAPPLLAVAVYFLVVHASGHCLRATTPAAPPSPPSLANAARVHARSAPLLIPSIAAVAAIAATLFGGLTITTTALAFLLFCVVGTLPHHLLWLGLLSRTPNPT